MSKLSNSLRRTLRDLNEELGKVSRPSTIKLIYRALVDGIVELYYDYPYSWYRSLVVFCNNVKFFWPHILHMRDFDSHYQLQLFCDSLEHLAKGLKRWNNCVGSEKNYRRCMTAAGKLRKAYADENYMDKSYQYLMKKNPIKFVKCQEGEGWNGSKMISTSRMVHDYKNTPEYYEKMSKVIQKRIKESEDKAKKEAWDYVHKYIESFWD